MANEIKSNLEPIEKSDLDLAGKFGPERKKMEISEESQSISQTETVNRSETKAEKPKDRESSYAQILSKVKTDPDSARPSDHEVGSDAEIISREKDWEGKIIKLVDIAENKGVIHAVEVARHLDNNYVLDELHARLCGEDLHQALVAKGLLKEI